MALVAVKCLGWLDDVRPTIERGLGYGFELEASGGTGAIRILYCAQWISGHKKYERGCCSFVHFTFHIFFFFFFVVPLPDFFFSF